MVEVRADAWTMPLRSDECITGPPRAPSYETGREGSRSQQGSQDFPAGVHTGKIERSAPQPDTEAISHIEDLENTLPISQTGKETTFPILGSKWNFDLESTTGSMKDSFIGKDIGCELESTSMKSAKEPLKGNKAAGKNVTSPARTRCAKHARASNESETVGESPGEETEISEAKFQTRRVVKKEDDEKDQQSTPPIKKKQNTGNASSSSLQDVTGPPGPDETRTPKKDDDVDTVISLSTLTSPDRNSAPLPTTLTEGKVERQQQSLQQQSRREWPPQTGPTNDDKGGEDEDDRLTTKYDDSRPNSLSPRDRGGEENLSPQNRGGEAEEERERVEARLK